MKSYVPDILAKEDFLRTQPSIYSLQKTNNRTWPNSIAVPYHRIDRRKDKASSQNHIFIVKIEMKQKEFYVMISIPYVNAIPYFRLIEILFSDP